MTLDAKILTVSDSVVAGTRRDEAGPLLSERLVAAGFAVIDARVVADGVESVERALRDLAHGFTGLILTTGGTGFSPRDLTPEGTTKVLEREAPGFGEVMRATNVRGPLSRARAGTTGTCLIINTPGSPTGALESLEAVIDLVPHALSLLRGDDDPHPPDTGGSTTTSS